MLPGRRKGDVLEQDDKKKRKTESESVRWLDYNEWETILIKDEEGRRAYSTSANIGFFYKQFSEAKNATSRRMRLTWPGVNRAFLMVLDVDSKNDRACKLSLIDQDEKQANPFLVFNVNGLNTQPVTIIRTGESKQWDAETDDIVCYFQEYLKGASKEKKSKDRLSKFSKEQFSTLVEAYKAKKINERLKFIRDNASLFKHQNVLWLNWSDSKNQTHQVKVNFGMSAFESSCLPEHAFLKMQAKENIPVGTLTYYRMLAYENFKKKNKKILDIWFFLDASIGELYKVEKGIKLSGNEIMQIYLLLAQFIQIKKTFTYDDSRLFSEEDNIEIPLRVLLALVEGQTWYMRKNFQLYPCENIDIVLNDRKDALWSQSPAAHQLAITDLQNFSCKEVADLCVMESKKSEAMTRLIAAHPEEKTLQTLAKSIYTASKQQSQFSQELKDLNTVLTFPKSTEGSARYSLFCTSLQQLYSARIFYQTREEQTHTLKT